VSDAPENAQTEVESSVASAGYSVSRSRHRKALIILACVAVGAVVFDHLTKYWAINTVLARLQSGEGPIEVIGTWVQFTYAENTGAAFSIGTGYTWIFSIVAVIVAIVILRTARNFIAFPNFPVFNVADSFITCSAVLMVVLTLFGIDYRGNSSRTTNAAPDGAK
jgi:signal peptidase II